MTGANGRWAATAGWRGESTPGGEEHGRPGLRPLASPLHGFGRMWRKHYRVALPGTTWTAQEIAEHWRAAFPTLWPGLARFTSDGAVRAGASARIDLGLGSFPVLSTGVLVLFEDDLSFTFMTPEGHAFAGWITFRVEVVDGETSAGIEVLFRTSDPVFDVLMGLGGHHLEDWQWRTVLRNLAVLVGAQPARPRVTRSCVDRRRQWHRASNLRGNGLLRTVLGSVRH